jgi:hypothetical protein
MWIVANGLESEMTGAGLFSDTFWCWLDGLQTHVDVRPIGIPVQYNYGEVRMKTMAFTVFLGSITLLAPVAANAANPPKPHHPCPPGERWVLQGKFLNEPAHWACVPRHIPPPR